MNKEVLEEIISDSLVVHLNGDIRFDMDDLLDDLLEHGYVIAPVSPTEDMESLGYPQAIYDTYEELIVRSQGIFND